MIEFNTGRVCVMYLEEMQDKLKDAISSGTVSWDKSELRKYLERGKSEFRESREGTDARGVELMTEGRIVKSKTPFVLFGIPLLVLLILLGLTHRCFFFRDRV